MADEVEINVTLVGRLVAAQFPQWADLPVEPVEPDGWDNTTFRLGDDRSVRLPSGAAYAPQVEKEHRWLPRLAPLLPLPIPLPLAMGKPGEGYPFPWSVYRWLDGEPATIGHIDDLVEFATALADFITAPAADRPRRRSTARVAQLLPRRVACGLQRREPPSDRRP